MARSVSKGPYVHHSLLAKVRGVLKKAQQENALVGKYMIYTNKRSSTILDIMVGMNISIHNGFRHHKIYIQEEMVGKKLGETLQTRKFGGHTNKNKSVKGGVQSKQRKT